MYKVFVAGTLHDPRGDAPREMPGRTMLADILSPYPFKLSAYEWEGEGSVLAEDAATREGYATFKRLTDDAASSDLMIAIMPEASIGTAMEMHAAYLSCVPIIVVTPLRRWSLDLVATAITEDMAEIGDLLGPPSLIDDKMETLKRRAKALTTREF